MHSNKLILFGLSPSHSCIVNAEADPIVDIKFNLERQDQISGKRKTGALTMDYATVICEIVTKSKTYKIRSLIKGCKLIEVNEKLTAELLKNKPESEGYIAIIMFKDVHDVTPAKLLSNIFKYDDKSEMT